MSDELSHPGHVGLVRKQLELNRQRIVDVVVPPKDFTADQVVTWVENLLAEHHTLCQREHDRPHNGIYDRMHQAGVKLSQQRLCQPFGDDQRRGLWLYHILEPQTWFKLVARVNGANSGALYIEERGNVNGYHKISKPEGHTWKSVCNLLLQTMPHKTRAHYLSRFKKFIHGWHQRGYSGIPDEAPSELEAKCWAPSWRRMCKVLLRNDYWCKGLGQTQPKSEAYGKYIVIRDARKAAAKAAKQTKRETPRKSRTLFDTEAVA